MSDQEYKEKTLNILTEGYFKARGLVQIDENKIIFDNNKANWERILYVVIGMSGLILFAIMPFIYIKLPLKTDDFIGIPFAIFVDLFCVTIIINAILNTERKIVFDRLAGTVTMRATILNWKPSTITIPFEKTRIGVTGGPMSYSAGIFLPNSKFRYLILMGLTGSAEFLDFMSFLVWFMDKNRPLPIGEEFAPYRKADYERRKTEGFPNPLYKSNIYMFDYDGDEERYTRTPGFEARKVLTGK